MEIQSGNEFVYIVIWIAMLVITCCCSISDRMFRLQPRVEEIELTRGLCPYCESVYSYHVTIEPKNRIVKCQNCDSIFSIPLDAPTIRTTEFGEPLSTHFEGPAVVAFGTCPKCGDSSYHDVSKDRMVRCQTCSLLFSIPEETPKVRVPYHPKSEPPKDEPSIRRMTRLRAECPNCHSVHSYAVEDTKEYHVLQCPDCNEEFTSQ
ncbi:MAG: hypothetical protein ACFFEA_02335 [Candidatus Thorarchaeota archaeon]